MDRYGEEGDACACGGGPPPPGAGAPGAGAGWGAEVVRDWPGGLGGGPGAAGAPAGGPCHPAEGAFAGGDGGASGRPGARSAAGAFCGRPSGGAGAPCADGACCAAGGGTAGRSLDCVDSRRASTRDRGGLGGSPRPRPRGGASPDPPRKKLRSGADPLPATEPPRPPAVPKAAASPSRPRSAAGLPAPGMTPSPPVLGAPATLDPGRSAPVAVDPPRSGTPGNVPRPAIPAATAISHNSRRQARARPARVTTRARLPSGSVNTGCSAAAGGGSGAGPLPLACSTGERTSMPIWLMKRDRVARVRGFGSGIWSHASYPGVGGRMPTDGAGRSGYVGEGSARFRNRIRACCRARSADEKRRVREWTGVGSNHRPTEPDRVPRRPDWLVSSDREREISKVLVWLSRSNSDGGRSPSAWWSRASLNQPMYSTTASSSCERER